VLCSVAEVEPVLAEVARVLKPGGSLLFIEHTSAHLQVGCPVWLCLAEAASCFLLQGSVMGREAELGYQSYTMPMPCTCLPHLQPVSLPPHYQST